MIHSFRALLLQILLFNQPHKGGMLPANTTVSYISSSYHRVMTNSTSAIKAKAFPDAEI